MLLHGVSARIGLETIRAGRSNFQVAAPYVLHDGASLQLSIATLPEARNPFLLVSLHTMKFTKMPSKLVRVIHWPKGMTTPFTIFNPCTFRKGCWSKDDQGL